MAVINKKNDKFNFLLSAAMALPGIAHATDVGLRSETVKLDYNHADYSESDNRMSAKVDQLAITVPILSSFELKIDTIQDVTSGASPVLYLADPADKPVTVMQAGASIQDTRNVYEIGAGYYGEKNYVSAKMGNSKEDDYDADFSSVDYVHYLNNKNTNILFSYAQSKDKFWNVYFPVGSASFDPFSDPEIVREREKTDFQFGIDQVLDKNSRVLLSFTSEKSSGNLSDPYKKVYVQGIGGIGPLTVPEVFLASGSSEALEQAIVGNGATITNAFREDIGIFNDKRPSDHSQLIYLAQYSRYFSFADAAVHIDVRLADDDWGANSQTIEAKWSQSLPDGYILTPGFRYYAQENAEFYNMVYSATAIPGFADSNHSSDYRLAGFGAYAYKLVLDKVVFEQLSVRVSYELYQRSYNLALTKTSRGSAIDDYDYQLISVSLGYLFK